MAGGKGGTRSGSGGEWRKARAGGTALREAHELPWLEGPSSYVMLLLFVAFSLLSIFCGVFATIGMNNMIFPGESLHVRSARYRPEFDWGVYFGKEFGNYTRSTTNMWKWAPGTAPEPGSTKPFTREEGAERVRLGKVDSENRAIRKSGNGGAKEKPTKGKGASTPMKSVLDKSATDKLPPKSNKKYTNADRNYGRPRRKPQATRSATDPAAHEIPQMTTARQEGKTRHVEVKDNDDVEIFVPEGEAIFFDNDEDLRRGGNSKGKGKGKVKISRIPSNSATSESGASNGERSEGSGSEGSGSDSESGTMQPKSPDAHQKKADELFLKMINMGFTDEQARVAVSAAMDVEDEASSSTSDARDTVQSAHDHQEQPHDPPAADGGRRNGTFEVFESIKNGLRLNINYPPSSGLRGKGLKEVVSEVMETPLPTNQLDQKCQAYKRGISNPIEDILYEVHRSDEDLTAFLNARANGVAYKTSHGHKRMDVLRTQCIVRLHPEVVEMPINVDRKETTLLGLLLRLQFIRRLEAAQVVPFPNYWWLVREVIEQGGDPDVDLGSGVTALHVAARFRQHDLAALMIDHGASTHARDYAGNTPLTYVLVTSNECIVMFSRCMIDDIPLKDKKHSMDGMFAMDELVRMSPTASKLYNQRILNDLIDKSGSERETTHALQKDTRRAVNEWNSAFVNLFFVHSQDIDRYDATTNLHRAAIYGATEGVKTMLVVAGANPLLVDSLHRTASHLAAARGNIDVVKAIGEVVKNYDSKAGTTTDVTRIGDGLGNTPKGLRTTTVPRPEPVKFDDEASINSGGWSQEVASELDLDYCDIKQVDGRKVTGDKFIRDFVLKSRPVVLRGVASHWAFRQRWSAEEFERRAGATVTNVGDIPYAVEFGNAPNTESVANYMSEMQEAQRDANNTIPGYIFNGNLFQSDPAFRSMLQDVPLPPPFLQASNESLSGLLRQMILEQETATQFYLGPAYTGAPFHFHEDAWNALAFGKKRWLMLPPNEGIYSTEPAYSFVRDKLGELPNASKVLQCVQNAGDVIYIPNMWSHLTLNLQESIGLAVEFKVGYWQ